MTASEFFPAFFQIRFFLPLGILLEASRTKQSASAFEVDVGALDAVVSAFEVDVGALDVVSAPEVDAGAFDVIVRRRPVSPAGPKDVNCQQVSSGGSLKFAKCSAVQPGFQSTLCSSLASRHDWIERLLT